MRAKIEVLLQPCIFFCGNFRSVEFRHLYHTAEYFGSFCGFMKSVSPRPRIYYVNAKMPHALRHTFQGITPQLVVLDAFGDSFSNL